MSDWRPSGPYIMMEGLERKIHRVDGVKVDEVVESTIFFEPKGCHLNKESIDMLKSNGWRRIIEYGNFPSTPQWRQFAQMLEDHYGYELEQGRRTNEPAGRQASPRKRNTSARTVSARTEEGQVSDV